LAATAVRFNILADPGVALSSEQQLGHGPYRQVKDFSAKSFCRQLADKLNAARANVDSRDWHMDWTEYERQQRAAEDQVASNHESKAVGTYAKAVHLLVSQAQQKLRSEATDASN
jgi:hypothetical protein